MFCVIDRLSRPLSLNANRAQSPMLLLPLLRLPATVYLRGDNAERTTIVWAAVSAGFTESKTTQVGDIVRAARARTSGR